MRYRALFTLVMLVCVSTVAAPTLLHATRLAVPRINLIETFDRDRMAWTSVDGSYSYGGGFLKLHGDGTNYASVYYSVMPFGELDFAVKMKRSGCRSCASGVVVSGYPFLDTFGEWDSGFEFFYDNHGFFRVYKQMAGSTAYQSIIKPKTFSYAINREGWNTLRVQVKGSLVRFIINDVLVYQYVQMDRILDYGYSGIIMSSSNTTDTLAVATAWVRNTVSFGPSR